MTGASRTHAGESLPEAGRIRPRSFDAACNESMSVS